MKGENKGLHCTGRHSTCAKPRSSFLPHSLNTYTPEQVVDSHIFLPHMGIHICMYNSETSSSSTHSTVPCAVALVPNILFYTDS